MKLIVPILSWLLPVFAFSQAKDSINKILATKSSLQPVAQSVKQVYKPEVLTSGFFDIVSNGQLNASARFLRLYIGEPGKFALPLSIYSGVSANNFQSQSSQIGGRSNEQLFTNYINPLSGITNLSIDGILFFRKKVKLTRSGFIYHFGERLLTGQRTGTISNPSTGKVINFLNSFGSAGLYFQTGAWDKNDQKNIGIFWFAVRYIGCYTRPSQIREFLPDVQTDGLYHGYSLGWGVEINKLVNIKVLYYKYVKKPEIDYSLPIYQFSFNYSMNR